MSDGGDYDADYDDADIDDYETINFEEEEYGSDLAEANVSDEENEEDIEDAETQIDDDIVEIDDDVVEPDAIVKKPKRTAKLAEINQTDMVDTLPVDKFTESGTNIQIAHIVDNNSRVTSNYMQMYEIAEILSIRACQLQNNPMIFTNVGGETSVIKMALKELKDGRCPLKIRRKVGEKIKPSGEKIIYYEEWSAREMTLPDISFPTDFA